MYIYKRETGAKHSNIRPERDNMILCEVGNYFGYFVEFTCTNAKIIITYGCLYILIFFFKYVSRTVCVLYIFINP